MALDDEGNVCHVDDLDTTVPELRDSYWYAVEAVAENARKLAVAQQKTYELSLESIGESLPVEGTQESMSDKGWTPYLVLDTMAPRDEKFLPEWDIAERVAGEAVKRRWDDEA